MMGCLQVRLEVRTYHSNDNSVCILDFSYSSEEPDGFVRDRRRDEGCRNGIKYPTALGELQPSRSMEKDSCPGHSPVQAPRLIHRS